MSTSRSFFSSPVGWVFVAFVAIALFFLIAEHRAHLGLVVPYLPLALVGLCVVLHSYMHGVLHARYPGERSHDQDRHDASSHRH